MIFMESRPAWDTKQYHISENQRKKAKYINEPDNADKWTIHSRQWLSDAVIQVAQGGKKYIK